jgi:glycerophosphoryl diester phosphodiesterase
MSDAFFDVSDHIYAHRGLWDSTRPENSLAAFEAARNARIGVELDVRLTADHVPVVFHDAGLDRMCGHRERLDRVNWQDLHQWRLPDGSPIPKLEDVLAVMHGLPVLIELKVDAHARDIADRVAELVAGAGGLLAVMSFDEPTVARLCAHVSDRPVGLLINADNHVEFDISEKAGAARAMGCDYVGPHHSLLAETEAVAGGLPMVTWTIRSDPELQLARKYAAAPIFEGLAVSQVAAA